MFFEYENGCVVYKKILYITTYIELTLLVERVHIWIYDFEK